MSMILKTCMPCIKCIEAGGACHVWRRLLLTGKKSLCILVLLLSRCNKYVHWLISLIFFWPALWSHPNALGYKLFVDSPRMGIVQVWYWPNTTFCCPRHFCAPDVKVSIWSWPPAYSEFKLSSACAGPSDPAAGFPGYSCQFPRLCVTLQNFTTRRR